MKKICVLFNCLIIAGVLFVSCAKKDVTEHKYTYKGESENWSAEYKVDGSVTFTRKDGKLDSESESENTLVVTYKGDLANLSTVKHLEIEYDCITGGGKIEEDYEDGESITSKTFTMNSGGNGAIPKDDAVIKVSINLDGEEQMMELVTGKE